MDIPHGACPRCPGDIVVGIGGFGGSFHLKHALDQARRRLALLGQYPGIEALYDALDSISHGAPLTLHPADTRTSAIRSRPGSGTTLMDWHSSRCHSPVHRHPDPE